jgi:cytochrome c
MKLKYLLWAAALSFLGESVPTTAARLAAPLHSAPQPPLGRPTRGAEIYETKCGACHSLDANRIGPKHRNLFGRKAGSIADFHYTSALKQSGIVWNAQTLDRWLQNPVAMVPGTAMGIRLTSAPDRADVIAYLRQNSR